MKMNLKSVGEKELKEMVLSGASVPKHIAFIMDGNGRWAKKRTLPRIAGHQQGVKTVRRMVEIGPEIGIDVMTFYTFSSENWKRPKGEVSALMNLLLDSINREIEDLKRNNVVLKVIGDLNSIPAGPRLAMENAIIETAQNSGLLLVLALSYSGRAEIVKAVNRVIEADVTSVDEESFSAFLDTNGLPDPDLLIRTSGEYRISNFLLYQIAYSEIIISERFWPEFRIRDLYECILRYQNRERRFGKISEQVIQ